VIIVTGSVVARPETFDQLLALAREHVERSRAEPGCISHDVYRGVDDPMRLVFFERWESRDALAAHFDVPASGAFVNAARDLTSESPTLEIYESEPTR
jgi:quinol monooxygenase YgiN